jgi:PIN domain nuclease of toxin-antitoxin system
MRERWFPPNAISLRCAGNCGVRSENYEREVARRYVLDTHACVFMLAAPRKLGRRARAAIERVEGGRDQAWVPAAAVAEIVILRGLGRIGIGFPELKRAMESNPGFQFLPLDFVQLEEFAALAAIRDPFDRLLVSAAKSIRGVLITRDRSLADGDFVQTVWA